MTLFRVFLDDPVSQLQLDRAAERLNNSLAGLDRRQIDSLQLGLDHLEQRVLDDSLKMMQESEQGDLPEHHVEGLSRLHNQPEFTAGERARLLVRMMEERVMLEPIVSNALETRPGSQSALRTAMNP